MAIVNHAKREINAKIVYYGHEGAGKGTSLRYIYDRIKPTLRGVFKTQATAGSKLVFFDFSPFEQPIYDGYRLRFHIYTLHGKITNKAAWKMTLKGADGLVIVADASKKELPDAQKSLLQLREFMSAYGVGLDDVQMVLQFNKADRAGQVTASELASELGLMERKARLTNAASGDGVLDVLAILSQQILERVRQILIVPQGDASLNEMGAEEGDEDVDFHGSADDQEPSDAVDPVTEYLPVENELFAGQADADRLQLKVTEEGVCVEGATIRIPLEITQAGGPQRLVVTVAISPG
jgi:signal recognition particle receptor subunit beta